MKIKINDFMKLLNQDVMKSNSCIEVEFSIEHDVEYDSCWLGKMPDKQSEKEVFWYGLVPDGSQAYDYNNLTDFVNAKVFRDKSLIDIWNHISIDSIDGCEPNERISDYLD